MKANQMLATQHATTDTTALSSIPPDVEPFVPIDETGNYITDEGDPAFLAGALASALEVYGEDPRITNFFNKRTILSGRYTVIDDADGISFAEGIIAAPQAYDIDHPCPPTPQIISAFNTKATADSTPAHRHAKAIGAVTTALDLVKGTYAVNQLAITVYDNNLCKGLSYIIQNPTTRLRLMKVAKGSTAALITAIKAEEATLTSSQRTAAKTAYNNFIAAGFPGSLELDPFELHLTEMKKQIRRLPQAARNLVDKRQEIEDMINLADESLAQMLRLEIRATPPATDEEHLDMVRRILRERETVSKLRELRGKTPVKNAAPDSAAQHVLVATSLRANGVNKQTDARSALVSAGYVGTSLESAMAVWSTTKDPNKRTRSGDKKEGQGPESKAGGRKGGWIKAPRDADDKLTGWIEGMEPCSCGRDTGGTPGALAGPGKHLQKTAGCGLLKPNDSPRVPSTKPPANVQTSNLVARAEDRAPAAAPGDQPGDVPTSSFGAIVGTQTSAAVTDGSITDPAVLEQLRQLWDGDGGASVSIPSTAIQQSNVVSTPGAGSEAAPGCTAFAGVGGCQNPCCAPAASAPEPESADGTSGESYTTDDFPARAAVDAAEPGYDSDDFPEPNPGLVAPSPSVSSAPSRYSPTPPSSEHGDDGAAPAGAAWLLPAAVVSSVAPLDPIRVRTNTALTALADAAFDENPSLFPHMGGATKGRATAFDDSATGHELVRGDVGRVALFVDMHAGSTAHVQGSATLRAAVLEARACFSALLAAGGDMPSQTSRSQCILTIAELIVGDFTRAQQNAIANTVGAPPGAGRKEALLWHARSTPRLRPSSRPPPGPLSSRPRPR